MLVVSCLLDLVRCLVVDVFACYRSLSIVCCLLFMFGFNVPVRWMFVRCCLLSGRCCV